MQESKYADALVDCKKVLDAGCGKGQLMREDWTGLDINPKFANGRIKTGSATMMPFKTESSDGVFACNFMEHLSYPDNIKFFNETYRVLKPKGLFLVITSCNLGRRNSFYDNPEHVRPWPINAFRQLLSDNEIKFKIIKHDYFGGVFPASHYLGHGFWDFIANKIHLNVAAIRVLMQKQ